MTWVQAIQSKLPLPRPEHRSNQEIEDDLDAEFAFHLEQSTHDVMNERGLVREDASDFARARFGNVESIKKRCKCIALEERIMLQRINFVLMLVVALMVIGVGVQLILTQRSNMAALRDITSQIAKMKFIADSASDASLSASSERRGGYVYIDGKVSRPGVYNLPPVGRLTVARLIAAAGGVASGSDLTVTVTSLNPDGTNQERFKAEHFKQDLPVDFILAADDHVFVEVVVGAGTSNGQRGADSNSVDRARADALYDFVKQLMSQVSAEHAGDHAYIRGVLDKMESELPTKYPNNPDLQGLIKEMIAGRRKILEYDERLPAPAPGTGPATAQTPGGAGATAEQLAAQQRLLAEAERAKAEAIEKFLRSLLASGDPNAPTLSMRELLGKATEKINTDYADNPDMQATLRKAVEDARKSLESSATAPPTTRPRPN